MSATDVRSVRALQDAASAGSRAPRDAYARPQRRRGVRCACTLRVTVTRALTRRSLSHEAMMPLRTLGYKKPPPSRPVRELTDRRPPLPPPPL
jgi:hypothetical protein